WPLPAMDPLAWTPALLAMTVATTAIEVRPLDMAEDSFDDQYRGCREDMIRALPALNSSDVQQNKNFALVWRKATANWQSRGSPGSPLYPAQAIAIMAYTMDNLYREFNEAVRQAGNSSQEYQDKFHFKTLHFLLTDALATLRGAQGQECHCVARGVRDVRFEARPGDIVRFGHFASASLCKGIAQGFGRDTEFQVYTCHGVAIKKYSSYPIEDEVLIPPFETFEVTEVTQKGDKAQIQLRSTGIHSNYNCEWLPGDNLGGTGTPS
ncbi:NARE ribosyltransferase, partial [Atrichornis clamosus]|nr:NARE ribosyltransferase [Atrichornis clamosus]